MPFYHLEENPRKKKLTDAEKEALRFPIITDGVMEHCGQVGRVFAVPEGVTEITDFACVHSNASKVLEELYLPDSVTRFHPLAFFALEKLRSVRLPAGLQELPASAFGRCTALESLSIPAGVRKLPHTAFPWQKDAVFSRIEVAEGNPCFCHRDGVLYTADGLELLAVPVAYPHKVLQVAQGTRRIGAQAFKNNRFLQQVILPESVEEIGPCAFEECAQLLQINLSHVKTVAYAAFRNCTRLAQAHLESAVDIRANAFAMCPRITSIRFGQNLKTIGRSAFEYCRGTRRLTLPEGLEDLGAEAFCRCPLEEVTVPKSISRLADRVFYSSRMLTVYDTIDPDTTTKEGKTGSSFTLSGGQDGQVIRVLSAETGEEKHRVLMHWGTWDAATSTLLRNAWGSHGDFSFAALDAHFPNIRGSEIQIEHAFHRLRYPAGLTEEAKKMYLSFLVENPEEVGKWCIAREDLPALQQFASQWLRTADDISGLLDAAAAKGNVEITAWLLEYRNAHFPGTGSPFQL